MLLAQEETQRLFRENLLPLPRYMPGIPNVPKSSLTILIVEVVGF